MNVALGADHGGFRLKEEIAILLQELGVSYHDFGTCSEESVDYPDFAREVAENVAAGQFDRGIICCGTGIGVSIAANKVPGIRAALCNDTYSARMSREHNDANVLTLGGRVVGSGPVGEIVRVWLSTGFAGGRHQRRIEKIGRIEHEYAQVHK